MPEDLQVSPLDGPAGPGERWRIGALASRVGVSETPLRAWELRYGLLSPTRSASGYRLYGPEDERRIRSMLAARERGVPAARAAADVLTAERTTAAGAPTTRSSPRPTGSVAWPTPRWPGRSCGPRWWAST